ARAWKGECTLHLSDLRMAREGLLLAIIPPSPPQNFRFEYAHQIQELARELGREDRWLAASMPYRGPDRRRLAELSEVAVAAGIPLIAINDVLYHIPERRELQDV